jgi:hypothetical protein
MSWLHIEDIFKFYHICIKVKALSALIHAGSGLIENVLLFP